MKVKYKKPKLDVLDFELDVIQTSGACVGNDPHPEDENAHELQTGVPQISYE